MPLKERTGLHNSSKPALDLPPPFRLISLREVGDAFAHASSVASDAGAGTLVYVGRFDLAEFAVVLEPEEPLEIARRAFYAGLVALATLWRRTPRQRCPSPSTGPTPCASTSRRVTSLNGGGRSSVRCDDLCRWVRSPSGMWAPGLAIAACNDYNLL